MTCGTRLSGSSSDPVPVTIISGDTEDGGAAWATVFGVSGARFLSANQSASPAAVTDVPAVGKKLVITDIVFSVDTAMRVDFKEEDGDIVLTAYMGANSAGQITPRGKLKLTTAGKRLQAQTSVAGNIAVTAFYYSET